MQLVLKFGYKKITAYTHTHSYTAVLRPFVWENPGGPVPEETFSHSHLKCVVEVCHHSGFYERGEDNRGKCADNAAGCHPIWTIDAPNSIIPQFYAGCPSCCNPPNLS